MRPMPWTWPVICLLAIMQFGVRSRAFAQGEQGWCQGCAYDCCGCAYCYNYAIFGWTNCFSSCTGFCFVGGNCAIASLDKIRADGTAFVYGAGILSPSLEAFGESTRERQVSSNVVSAKFSDNERSYDCSGKVIDRRYAPRFITKLRARSSNIRI